MVLLEICEDHNVNAKCSIDTKREKTVFTTRAQVHHGESEAIDRTLPQVDCSYSEVLNNRTVLNKRIVRKNV